jgi:MFS family permease
MHKNNGDGSDSLHPRAVRISSDSRYVLAMLTLVYTFSLLDRGLIILLLQPIKEDLHLSDTNLGFLTGIAFGLFYATLGVPIARWADRGNRVTIASLALTLWGCTVMLCLFVGNFIQLAAARVAAGVGEAGCMPPTYSLLGDYFPGSRERMRAMTVYMLATPLALLTSFILGGWLNERYGWRVAFFFMGMPALLVTALLKLTVSETRLQSGRAAVRVAPSIVFVLRTVWGQRSTRHLGLGIISLFTMGLGLSPWYAAFMIRSHGMSTSELGVWLGAIFGLGGILGISTGGYVVNRWFAGDERGQLRLSAVIIGSLVPCFAAFLLLAQKYQALIALVPLIIVCNFIFGPMFALLQRLVSDSIRATTLSIIMLLANLIGMGIGPQVVGLLSDLLKPLLADNSLRIAMLAMSSVSLGAAYFFWRAGDTVAEDLADLASALSNSARRGTASMAEAVESRI